MIIYDNPVGRGVTASMTEDWLIAGHAECAGAKWQCTVIRNIVADSHIYHPVVRWPENRRIRCYTGDGGWRVRRRRGCCRRVVRQVGIIRKRSYRSGIADLCAVGH